MDQQKEINFNKYVQEKAKELLDEVKSNKSTYGEVRKELKKLIVSAQWEPDTKNYLIVINEAQTQLENEIDATTLL
ncbi:hypothetical protein [Rummeliibacillus stabekisii]|uniref:Uncharacterized protein n=1 Tax=Rummeliibacillus stabekisii TaxID=241244 RepID=A0A143HAR1_9BACL|nr:hypothetical protein [Rummeliibacillus stabekisii]AMW98421.1 hypothetical protein ATY39_02630 [Rummeliibacillus stabekisii]